MEDETCYYCYWWIANPKDDTEGKCIPKSKNTGVGDTCKKFKPSAGEDNP